MISVVLLLYGALGPGLVYLYFAFVLSPLIQCI